MATILVSGGAGYIGSHTCVELLAAGHDVVVFDNFSNSKPDALDKIRQISGKDFRFYEADMRDRAAMEKIFAENKIDAVIHFAGLKAVGESVHIPLAYYETNLGGTFVLCDVMAKAGCKKMVFSSSATVYGMHNPVPFNEEMPTSATNPYGYTKVMIEQILCDLWVADNTWGIALLRYFNPIGAHSSGLIGEDPNGIPNNLLPYVAQVAAGKLKELSLYGNDYDTPDGTGVRDYIHVVDLAQGHVAALKHVLANSDIEAVNLGTGCGSSVLDIVHAFEKASGRPIPYKIMPRRGGDIATCYADTGKAKAMYGWESKKNIDDMCADGWRFASKTYLGL